MKRILSITLLALAVLPAVVNANARAYPLIKLKSSGSAIFRGSQPQLDHNLTISEGSSVTLTVELDGEGTSHFQRRVRLLQDFITVPPYPTNTHNPDVLIDAGTRDEFTTNTPERFGYKANNATIRFSRSNYNQPVDVVITAKHDDDAINDTFRIQIPTSSHYLYINGTVTDDDTNKLVIEEPTSKSLVMNEGQSKSFKLKLGTQPDGDVSVLVSASNQANLALSGDVTPAFSSTNNGYVSFNRSNWNTAKTVTVTGSADSGNSDRTGTIQLTGQSGSNYSGISETISVKVYKAIRADRNRNFIIVDEGSSDAEVQYWLTSAPPADREITVSTSHADLKVFTGTNTPSRNLTLTFTPANWQQRQTIKVAAEHDDDALDTDHFIHFAMGNGLINAKSYRMRARVQDDDLMLDLSRQSLTIGEGESATVNVKLESDPSHDRTINLRSSNGDVTVSPGTLTFTRGDSGTWKTYQAVTVSAAQDDDTANDSATLTLGANGVRSETVSVTVTDDDVELELSASSLAVDEGSSDTFTVQLESTPNSNVTVNLASDDTDIATVSPATLTFTSSNWGTAQTVTVSGVQDNNATDATTSIKLTGTAITPQTVSVSVTDDDEDTLVLSPTSQTIDEGEDGSFSVRLAWEPSGSRTVILESNNDDVTVSPTTLTFTAGNYSDAQTVMITAAADSDAASEDVTITLTGDDFVDASVTVRVRDDDEVRLTLSKSVITMNEGATDTFTVQLAEEPGGARSITLASSDAAVVTLSSTTLDFTTSDWRTAQTVTVNAVQDSGTASNTATITMTGAGISDDSLAVSVTDDEPVELVLSDSALNVIEGTTGIVTVALKSEPAVERMVTLASNNDDVTLSPATLTFTTSDWGTAQTVTVTAGADSDLDDDEATVNLTGAGITADSFSVSVTDDDVDMTLSTASLSLREGDTTRFTVRLAEQPLAGITVTLTQPTNTDVTIDKTSLRFTRQNWSSPQEVSVSASDDGDSADDMATIELEVSSTVGSGISKTVEVSVIDDDQPGLDLSTDSLAVQEGGDGSFRVRLHTEPAGDVTVMLTEPGDLTLNRTELMFTASNWENFQTITVTAGQDDDGANDTATIEVSTSGSYGNYTKQVTVTVADNDNKALRLSAGELTVLEGTEATFTVRLATQPSANVRVTLASPSNTDVTVDTDTAMSGDQDTLDFTAANWEDAQTVTVRIAQDGDSVDDGSATVGLSAAGGDYAGLSESVSVVVKDDDVPRLDIAPTELTVDENGSATFEVKLGAAPPDNTQVMVTLTQPSNTDVTVDTDTVAAGNQHELTFTDANWEDAQTVTVSAAEDADTTNDTASVLLSAAGGGGYDSITGTLSVSVTDNDDVGLTLSASALSIAEEGDSENFTVRLASQPSGDRTVRLVSNNNDITVSPTSLTFTLANWQMPQSVAVSAADDDDKVDDEAAITLSGDSITQRTVTVAVTDNDLGLTLSTETLTIAEGEKGSFSVKLDTQPRSERTFFLGPDNADVDVSTYELDFAPGNWNVPQIVTVLTDRDLDLVDDTATITIRLTRDGDAVVKEVMVTVTDDAEVEMFLSKASLAIVEGASDTFTVQLYNRPAGNVTVALAAVSGTPAASSGAVTISPTSLEFTTENWGTSQTVTVSGAEDSDTEDANDVVINVTGAGIEPESVRVMVTDNDLVQVGLDLSKTALAIDEGASDTFTVRLNADPEREVRLTLAVSGADSGDVTIVDTDPGTAGNQSTLTFTGGSGGNWNTFQTVTVSAAEDDDREDDSAMISITGTERVTAASLPVAVTDNDKNATLEVEKEAAAVILAEVAGALLPAASDTIGLRFGAERSGRSATVGGQQIALDRSLAQDLAAGFAARAGVQDVSQSRFAEDRFGAERHSSEWLGGIPLDAGRPVRSADERMSGASAGSALLSGFSYALNADADGAGSGWSIWGRFDTGEFSGTNDGVEFDSSRSSIWFGADRRTDSGLLSGVAYSSSGTDADYTLGRFGAALETDLTLVLPYLETKFDGGGVGHALLGLGSGQATITQTDSEEGTADLSMYMLAAGGSWPTDWEIGSGTLQWSGDFGYTSMSTSGSDKPSLNGLSVSSMQLKGGMELAFDAMGDSLQASPRAALLMRLDAGDGITGTGFELTGGMLMTSASSDRFSLDFNLRTLVMHSAEELTDWGMSIQLRFNTRSDGGGLEFAAGPHWGDPDDDLLDRDEAFRLDEAGRQSRQMRGQSRGAAASLGYGLRAFGGLLTPYSEYRFTSGVHGSIRQVAGVRFSGGEALRLSLFSERQIAQRGEARSRLAVELQRRY
ncbi:MAG: hypothetical protein ISN29_10775 [Gammaproteobacteria bacterium AqS3]|nr:hypothetical protein [Gammaproteobacteria bacterium AqS3]